jgi:invasion protein IalB
METGMHWASKYVIGALAAAAVAAIAVIAFGQAPAQRPTAQAQAQAQKPKPAAPAAPPAAAQPASPATADNQNVLPSRWVSRCVSDGRIGTPDCAVEQSAVVTQTGQLLASVTVRVPADTRHPVIMIQLPVGLFLPAGVTIQVDEGKPQQISLQTCDLKGCYGGAPLTDETLAAMKAGKRFAVSFQNASKENLTIPFGLANFAEAYQHIQ